MNPSAARSVLRTPLAQELLESPLLMRLAYIGTDNYPRVVPIGYVWNGEDFVVCTAEKAPKVRALKANPRVAITIDTDAMPPHILLARGTARIQIVDGIPPEYLEASRKALPEEQWAAFESQVRGLYPRMARITVSPEWAKLIDFETTLPVAVEELVRQRSDGE